MTAALTTKQTRDLNRMNRAAANVQLGTMLNDLGTVATGSYTAVAADMNGSRVVLTTGLSSVGGYMAQGRRSGSPLMLKINSGSVAGTLVAENTNIVTTVVGGSIIQTGDVFNYVAFM